MEPTKRDLIFSEIRELLMSGTPKAEIAKQISEKFEFQIRAAYKWIEKFMKSDEFFADRADIRTQIKTSMWHMYQHSYTKGWTRSALEVLDRLFIMCPWLKENDEDRMQAPIRIEIVEYEDKVDENETEESNRKSDVKQFFKK